MEPSPASNTNSKQAIQLLILINLIRQTKRKPRYIKYTSIITLVNTHVKH